LGGYGGANTSEGGTVALMTGVPTLGLVGQQDHCAGGESIDQLFLDQSPVLGGAGALMSNRTPFGSLQLAADVRSSRDEVAPRAPAGADAGQLRRACAHGQPPRERRMACPRSDLRRESRVARQPGAVHGSASRPRRMNGLGSLFLNN
jgi:hypothetical protein